MGDDRPSGYVEGKDTIYRASSSGMCLTALVASRIGYKADRSQFAQTTLMNAAKEGNLHEDAIVEDLKANYGYRVWGSQDTFDMKVIPHVFMRGHIDGICRPKGARNDRVLEIKTMSKNRFSKWKNLGDIRSRLTSDEFSSYGYQISTYMTAMNMQAVYVVKNRDSGELTIDEIKLPPYPWKGIKKKIIQAEMFAKREEIPPCTASSGDQFFCAYPYLHDDNIFRDEPLDEPSVIDNATEALVGGMAAHYHDIAQQIKPLKPLDDERKELGQKIITALGGPEGTKTMTAGGFKVTRSNNSSKYTDKEALADELGITVDAYTELLEKHKKARPYSYVRITKLGDK